MRVERIVCWEADATNAMTQAAGRLYERTLEPDERIPWAWVERSLAAGGKPNARGWSRHLLLAAPEGKTDDPAALAGYAYGAWLPGFGGYLCYLGVAETARRHGVGSRLMGQFFKVMAVDAGNAGEPLPFVVWESHQPGASATDADWNLWTARTRLFDRVGGLWVEGVDFQSPNFADDDGPPVPLQLFMKPVDVPATAFDAARLTALVGGLHERVYKNKPGDALYVATLPPGTKPRLRPAKVAGQRRATA